MRIRIYPNWKMNFNSKNGTNRSFSYETQASITFIPMRKMCLWCLILKRKEITMWIHVYLNWKTNFNFKIYRKISFSYKTKASKLFIPMRRMWLWCLIMKRKKIIMWIHLYPNWRTNYNSKNSRKRSCSYETKALIPFIPMRRMCLWRPIMKQKEIIIWIHVYPNWKANFNSKNNRNRSFSYETKASISFIPMRRMCLWCPVMKRKEIIMWIWVYPIENKL